MQQNSNTFLLESKLKRLKISFSKQNGKLIIAQAKRDYTVLIALIFFPLFLGTSILLFLIFSDEETRQLYTTKVYLGVLFLFSVAVGSFVRMRIKQKQNKAIKILGYKEIIIKTKEHSHRFDANTIEKFQYSIKKAEEEVYYGTLFLVDTTQQKHALLGLEAETEQYLLDDMHWFINYFTEHVQLNV